MLPSIGKKWNIMVGISLTSFLFLLKHVTGIVRFEVAITLILHDYSLHGRYCIGNGLGNSGLSLCFITGLFSLENIDLLYL